MTWHQKSVVPKLYHESKWTVVTDMPHGTTCCNLFDSKQDAEAYIERCKATGVSHQFILQPANLKYTHDH